MKPRQSAADILAAAAKTFAERNKVYGNNYINAGNALAALFPNGVSLITPEDHNRFQIFNLIIVKLSRYAVQWDNGGHADSIHDAAVYCALVEAIDQEIKERK